MPTKPRKPRRRKRQPPSAAAQADQQAMISRNSVCFLAQTLLQTIVQAEFLMHGRQLPGDEWQGDRPLPDGRALADWSIATAEHFVARANAVLNAPLPSQIPPQPPGMTGTSP